jgi:hypothetical protein
MTRALQSDLRKQTHIELKSFEIFDTKNGSMEETRFLKTTTFHTWLNHLIFMQTHLSETAYG